MDPLITLQNRINYSFKLPVLLSEALTHKSFAHEKAVKPGLFSHNERLEFLGDAVLDLAVSHMLMHSDVKASEGDLSKRRASLVNEELLAQVAAQISLGDFIILGKGEMSTKGQSKPSIMSSTFEAIVGAIYLDGGFEKALGVLTHLMGPLVQENLKSQTFDHDYKTRLQEITQANCKQIPKYQVVSAEGPDHNKKFFVRVSLGNDMLGEGAGKSKKEAEQKAAFQALEKYK